jgi:GNAT superfamily N-acetyltransferase
MNSGLKRAIVAVVSKPVFSQGWSKFKKLLDNMQLSIRQAAPQDAKTVTDILGEATRWLESSGKVMWWDDELLPSRLAVDVEAGLFHVAVCNGEIAGVIKFQLEDLLFWPDIDQSESAFIHRLAVRRRFAGGLVSSALLQWAVDRTRRLDRRYLRLDCEASRPRLRALYERFGFTHHSDKRVEPYFVSRYEYDVDRTST